MNDACSVEGGEARMSKQELIAMIERAGFEAWKGIRSKIAWREMRLEVTVDVFVGPPSNQLRNIDWRHLLEHWLCKEVALEQVRADIVEPSVFI